MQPVRLFSIRGAAVALILAATGQVPAMQPETLSKVSRATVFIKVERVFTAEQFATAGTGFFVDSRGYVMTAHHVVDSRTVVSVNGRMTQASAPVRGIFVVIDSGTPREREIEATVVARDREHDLALLRVRTPAPSFLDVRASTSEPRVTGLVWAAGYPFGELLAVARWTDETLANPELSINMGRVTSLRKDETGKLAMIQTDAAVNPGNSGGPLLDEQGQLLGMVFAKIGDSSGVGFAVPNRAIRSFMSTSGFSVSFAPPVLTESTTALRILVDPMLADLSSRSAVVTLSGGNIDERRAVLQPSAGELVAVVAIDETAVDAASRDLLRATLTVSGGGEPEVKRSFRIRAAVSRASGTGRENEAATEIESRPSAAMPSLSGGLKGNEIQSPRKQASVVVSDQTMHQIEEWRFSEQWYEHLPVTLDRELAQKYDRAMYDLYRLLVNEKSMIGMVRSTYAIERRPDCMEMKAKEARAKQEVNGLQRQLRERGICRCSNTWYPCESAPCPDDEAKIDDEVFGILDKLRCREQ